MFPPTNYLAVSLQRSSSNPNPLIRKQCWRVNRDTRSILSAGKSLAGSRSWEEKTLCAAPRAKGHPPHTHLRFLTQGRRQQRWLEFPRTQNYKARTHWQGTNLVAVQNEKLWKKTMGQNLKQSPKSSERPRTGGTQGTSLQSSLHSHLHCQWGSPGAASSEGPRCWGGGWQCRGQGLRSCSLWWGSLPVVAPHLLCESATEALPATSVSPVKTWWRCWRNHD